MDEMLESDNTQIFTQDVRTPHYIIMCQRTPTVHTYIWSPYYILCVSDHGSDSPEEAGPGGGGGKAQGDSAP